MKKLTLLFTCLAFVGITNAQTVADFETASDYDLTGSWGYTTAPEIADDGTSNALKVERDNDTTFAQGVLIRFNNPVTPDAGNNRLVANIKGITGTRGYAKIYQNGSETVNNWWSKEDGSTLSADDTYEEFVIDGISGDQIDSMIIHLGGWDNGNVPSGLQGTFYIDDITVKAPPAVIVKPRKVIDVAKRTGDITLDGLPTEEDWQNAANHDIVNYDSSDYDGSYTGHFKVLWDDDYLYILFNAMDATPTEYDGDVDTWKRDGFQGYWDVRNMLLEGRKDNATQHQLNFGYGNSVLTGWQGSIVDSIYVSQSMETEWASQTATGGYFIETRIPWACMYFDGVEVASWAAAVDAVTITAGDTIGFDMQANDYVPDSDSREAAMTWSAASNDTPGGYQNSGVWGGLKLVEGDDPGTAISTVNITEAKIYPNPASEAIYIEMEGMTSITVYDITGRQILMNAVNGLNETSININSLSAGMYLVKVKGAEGTAAQRVQVQ